MADDPKSCINFKFLQKSSSHPRNAFSSNSPICLNKISYFCLLVSSLIWSNAQMCSSYILLASRLHTLMMYCRLCFEILWLQLLHATFERLLWQKLGGRTSVSLQLWQLMKRLWSQTSMVNASMTRFQLYGASSEPRCNKKSAGSQDLHRGSPNLNI